MHTWNCATEAGAIGGGKAATGFNVEYQTRLRRLPLKPPLSVGRPKECSSAADFEQLMKTLEASTNNLLTSLNDKIGRSNLYYMVPNNTDTTVIVKQLTNILYDGTQV